MKNLLRLIVLCILILPFTLFAQKEVIQFSGIVKDSKSGNPLPFCGIFISNTYRGTTSNMNGFYSLPAAKGDTIVFQSVGYRTQRFVIPAGVQGTSLTHEVNMVMDTIRLKEIVIVPLPAPNQLRQAIISLDLPNDLADLAEVAIAQASLEKNSLTTSYDGSENYKAFTQQFVTQQYFVGQSAPIQLMNPLAWAQFIQALKNGDFKRK